jgi:hypothetical protein
MKTVMLDFDAKSNINIVDSFIGRGNVLINLRNSSGEIIETIENHNLIVKTGRSELINQIAGQGTTTGRITKCAVGSNGAPAANPFSPVAPIDGDTGLATLVLMKDIGAITVDTTQTNPKVTFTTLFTCTETNSLVNECGLFFADGITMFARYTFKTLSSTLFPSKYPNLIPAKQF